MSSFIDISVKGSVGTLTKQIKPLGLTTAILLKVPKHDMTTVRVTGELAALQSFIRTRFDSLAAPMHLRAIKPVPVEKTNA